MPKTKYTKELIESAVELAKQGLNDVQIAKELKIDISTFARYLKKNEFKNAIEDSRKGIYVKQGGPESKYDESFPAKARIMAGNGYTNEEIAKALGIGETAFYSYCNSIQEFSKAIREARKPINLKVERALIKRCLGYQRTKRKVKSITSPEEIRKARERGIEVNSVLIQQETEEYFVEPDVGAIKYWLSNRMKDRWGPEDITDKIDNFMKLVMEVWEDKEIQKAIDEMAEADEHAFEVIE